MFSKKAALVVFWVVACMTSYAFGQSCLFTEPASNNCLYPRVIPGTVGHHVVLMDSHAASDTGTLCSSAVGNKVYFRVTPTVTGYMTVSTCHPMTMYDTVLEVASGVEFCETGTVVACNDDTAEPDCTNDCGTNRSSKVVFWATAGTTYTIRVGSYNNNSAGCSLCLGLIVTIGNPCGEVPRNFICQEARELPGTFGSHEAQVDVTGAPSNPQDWPCASNVGHPVWFKFTAAIDGFATFSTCNPSTTYDTVVRVVNGCSGIVMELACNDDSYDPDCATSCSGRASKVSFAVNAGAEYLVAVGAYNDNAAGCDLCLGVRLTLAECMDAGDCDDGNPCTEDTCGAGTCEHGYELYGTQCTEDGNLCTDDICNGFGGCIHPYAPSGTACGDPSDTACTNPDTCNGAGACLVNNEPYGVTCTDDGNPCTTNICNGSGGCIHPYAPSGTACGDPSDTACTNPDTCNGAGACLVNDEPYGVICTDDGNPCTTDICNGTGGCTHPYAPSGTACGDPSDTVCTDPDTCDGAGACLANHASSGTPCPDGWFCNGLETCSGTGDCEPGTFPCLPNEICNEDMDRCDIITEWYVNPGESIQAAIDTAFSFGGGTVHASPGTYYETITLRNGVTVLGAGAGMDPAWDTIINGDAGDSVVKAIGVDATAIIDGFLITNGAALQGGGILLDGAAPVVSNCWIRGNSADRGGGVYSAGAAPLLVNCVISDNTADVGAGMAFGAAATPLVINCSIIGNTAAQQGAGIFTESNGSVRNSICWANAPDGIAGNADVTFSDVQGGYPGTGNLDQAPRLTDIGNGDYHLQADSPCLDAGSNDAVPAGFVDDLEGSDRIVDSDGNDVARVDMGALETPLMGLRLSGYVYAGAVGDQSTPFAGVGMELYCAGDAGTLGTLQASVVTDDDGWYWMMVPDGYAYANILETDPAGYLSAGATTAGGTVRSDNWIQYAQPVDGKTLTGNNFWDVVDPVPGGWAGFMPSECVNTRTVTCAIQVADSGSGLEVSSAEYAFSTDGGGTWSSWLAASCSGADGTNGPETITAGYVAFGQDSQPGDRNQIRFRIDDLGGNRGQSDNYAVAIDGTAPAMVAAPTVTGLSPSSAHIVWETSEESDSRVIYGRGAGVFDLEAADAAAVTQHDILLDDLEPSATYEFMVQSTDPCGNLAYSRAMSFVTEPELDGVDPQVIIEDPGICEGTVVISADASDDQGVEKVEFFLDDVLIFTDFSPPFSFALDTGDYTNGEYLIKARVTDLAGRTVMYDRNVLLENFVDTGAPEINLFHPQDGATVSGQIACYVNVKDDSGWSDVEWFIDGHKFGGGAFPVSPSLDIKFWLDTRSLENRRYTLAVRATDKENNSGVGTIDIFVSNSGGPAKPDLVVEKHELFRHGDAFAVELTIKNQGNLGAKNIEIRDVMRGFQVIPRKNFNGSDYDHTYHSTSREDECIITSGLSLDPGSSRTYIFPVVPVLIHPNPPTPSLGHQVKLSYEAQNTFSTPYTKQISYAVSATTDSPGADPSSPTAIAHAEAIKEADYLIMTHPNQLFTLNPGQDADVNAVLSEMATLAFDKNGALGYLNTTNRNTIQNLIRPTGDWAKRMHADFRATGKGYLLIVGETEVVPSWNSGIIWNIAYSNSTCNTREVQDSDLPYANTGGSDAAPELIVGRIIGNTAADLAMAIQTSNRVTSNYTGYGFDRSDAFLVSGTDGTVCTGGTKCIEKMFTDFVDDEEDALDDEFSVTAIHFKDITAAQRVPTFRNNTSGKDVVVYMGHGLPDDWGDVGTADVLGDPTASPPVPAVSFGTTNPLAFGLACLTGSYEDHTANGPCGAHDGGDDNIAEAFFDRQAAVFIGATEVSEIGRNSSAGKSFFETYWKPDTTMGKAFTEVKRDKWSGTDDYWQLWVWEYNFYGDPKYGSAPANTPPAAPGSPFEYTANGTPPDSIDVIVPDYETTLSGELHYVDIPGGDHLLTPGDYRIPYYYVRIEYPQGYRIQNVIMTDRADPAMDTGLNLAVNQSLISSGGPGGTAPGGGGGWTPEEDFSWRVTGNPDGTSTLTIIMYAFQYHPELKEAMFFSTYSFAIGHTISPVAIASVATDEDEYTQDSPVAVCVRMSNDDIPTDVVVGVNIKQGDTDFVVEALLLQTLPEFAGEAEFCSVWDSTGFDPGYYRAEVTLRTNEGDALGLETKSFRLGKCSGELTTLMATPEHFEVGDAIDISMTFSNTGTIPVSGAVITKVQQDATGQIIHEFKDDIIDLAPTSSVDISHSWDTSSVPGGIYHIVSYGAFDSMVTNAAEATVSTSTCLNDFDHDGDVDGGDLCTRIELLPDGESIEGFAAQLGRVDCFSSSD